MDAVQVREWAKQIGEEAGMEYARLLRLAAGGRVLDSDALRLYASLETAMFQAEAIAVAIVHHEDGTVNGGAR